MDKTFAKLQVSEAEFHRFKEMYDLLNTAVKVSVEHPTGDYRNVYSFFTDDPEKKFQFCVMRYDASLEERTFFINEFTEELLDERAA